MKLPDTDDLMLFGSVFFFGVGCGAAIGATTGNALLSIGIMLIAVAVPTAVITFLAAGEHE